MWSWVQSAGSALASASALDWALVALGVAFVLYRVMAWKYGHFRRRGMPYERPVPILGSMAPALVGGTSLNDFIHGLYKKYEGRQAFGMFSFLNPMVIRDPDLIKMVTVKEFDHFVDHQEIGSEDADTVNARSLFGLRGQEWRDMRATLSPAFTSSKMRNIFTFIEVCGQQSVKFLKQKIEGSPGRVYEAEMKDFFTRIANDVIATTAFGIECDSLSQPNNEFYRMGRDLTNSKGIRGLIFLGYFILSPRIMEFFRIPFLPPKSNKFFHDIVHDTIGQRQKKGIFRPDMLQLLMQAREGTLRAEAGDEQEVIRGAKAKALSDKDVTAQAIIFFFAGFDTVSTAASYCAYALARHPEHQEKVQREVDEAFEMNEGQLTYEAATQHLKYLDMFISEVQRLYASAPWLNRKCTKDFTIPAHGDVPAYTVRKGEVVLLPVSPVQRDPKYWDDPETFDPERFSDENKHRIQPYTYMPFGIGPRICIGNRFALLEVKVALAHIVRDFSFQMTPKTPKKVEYLPNDISGGMKGGFWVGVAPRAK